MQLGTVGGAHLGEPEEKPPRDVLSGPVLFTASFTELPLYKVWNLASAFWL